MRSIRPVAAAVALTVVLVTAGCAGTFDGATAPGTTTATPAETEDTGGRTIQVVAAGQVDAEPDQALVRVAVVETASNITTVRRRLAANVSQLRAALADRGADSLIQSARRNSEGADDDAATAREEDE